jgi:hypothetical protein
LTALWAAQKLVTFECGVAPDGAGQAVVTNRSTVRLTAYVLQVISEPCNPIEAGRQVFRGYDAITADSKPIEPSASRTEALGVAHCNKDAVSTPIKALFQAALFEDGATEGEKKWIDALIRHRKIRLQQWDALGDALQSARDRNLTRQQMVTLLRKSSGDASQAIAFSDADPFQIAISELKAPGGISLDELSAIVRNMRNRLRAALTIV